MTLDTVLIIFIILSDEQEKIYVDVKLILYKLEIEKLVDEQSMKWKTPEEPII